ncbi:MAG TPA: cytochrome c-type biogenesis protein [Rhizomicrobium sp.]|jgi:cytochrome c-type biogenesis protein CcmH|nr:cytochrome c-type biogenesis protein [Rhizomicrobium sp.]
MKGVFVALLALFSLLAMPRPSHAQPADTSAGETFSNPNLEARARHLQRQLRCLVCPGESVDESASPFSADIRHLVRQQIAAGQSDQQIEDFLVARYGDSILMKPPVVPDTWLLWLAPFLVLGTGGIVAWLVIKKAAAREA